VNVVVSCESQRLSLNVYPLNFAYVAIRVHCVLVLTKWVKIWVMPVYFSSEDVFGMC
jgi:hypothetical protein